MDNNNFLGGLFRDPKWVKDLLTKKRKISCADNSYLENNGIGPKAFKVLLKLVGNRYSGD